MKCSATFLPVWVFVASAILWRPACTHDLGPFSSDDLPTLPPQTLCWVPSSQSQCSVVCGTGHLTIHWNCVSVVLDVGRNETALSACQRAQNSTSPIPTAGCSALGQVNKTLISCSQLYGCSPCPSQTIHVGLVWPGVKANGTVRLHCPVIGVARGVVPLEEYTARKCVLAEGNRSSWLAADLSHCSQMSKEPHSIALANLKLLVLLNRWMSLEEVSGTLRNLTSLSSPDFTPSDIQTATEIAELLVSASASADSDRNGVLEELLGIVGDLLGAKASELVLSNRQARTSQRLLNIVNIVGRSLLLADAAPTLLQVPNIALTVACLNPNSHTEESLSIHTPDPTRASQLNPASYDVRMALPADFPVSKEEVNRPDCRYQKLQFAIFSNAKLFIPSAMSDSGTPRLREAQLVMSLSVGVKSVSGLKSAVEFTFNLSSTHHEAASKLVCAYWNFSDNGGYGGWQRDGIVDKRSKPDSGIHSCSSSHLTHFAILVDTSGSLSTDFTALSYASLIGCVLSLLGVIATFSTMLLPGYRSHLQGKVIGSLCVAIFGLLVMFIVAAFGSLSGSGCVAVGLLLHFFLLATFMWMVMEGVHLCRSIVTIFVSTVTNNVVFIVMSCLSWGLPFLIVILTLLSSSSYNKSGICYVNGTALYIAVVAPLAIVMATNWIIFLVIARRLHQHRRRMNKRLSQPDGGDKFSELIRDVKSSLALASLLGLTWIFGLAVLDTQSLAVQWIFTILTVLQGAIIFLVQVGLRPKAHREWRKALGKRERPSLKRSMSSNGSFSWTRLTSLRRQFSQRSTSANSSVSEKTAVPGSSTTNGASTKQLDLSTTSHQRQSYVFTLPTGSSGTDSTAATQQQVECSMADGPVQSDMSPPTAGARHEATRAFTETMI